MSSGTARSISDRQAVFTRQATILRKNLQEWDRMLRTPRGEDWPTMLGRLNAALNQASSMDKSIDPVLEHFVYVPKQATANPQDISTFLSTRLATTDASEGVQAKNDESTANDPGEQLAAYENAVAKIAADYEKNMVRF